MYTDMKAEGVAQGYGPAQWQDRAAQTIGRDLARAVPQQEPEIQRELEALDKAIEVLRMEEESLIDRLSPVRHPGPNENSKDRQTAPVGTPLGCRLNVMREKIEAAASRLRMTRDELGI